MKELVDIINAYDKAVQQNKKTALATVVKVTGSSYRRPGARMLVTEDGELTGAISGGCLEGDALRKALFAIRKQKNKLVIYDSTDEDDAKLGIQLGCNGIIYILFEPINNNHTHVMCLLRQIFIQRSNSVVATIFNEETNAEQIGTSFMMNEYQSICLNKKEKELLKNEAEIILQNHQTVLKKMSKNEILFQFIPIQIKLVIAGAGNDVIPLTKFAENIGWQTTIIDGRKTHATKQRFPFSEIFVIKPKDFFDQFIGDESTLFALMTHNYNYDLEMLKCLSTCNYKYVGLLGSKEKKERILNQLHFSNIDVSNNFIDNLYAPMGLDIGAETAEEIALSIISEIKIVLNNKDGKMLRNKINAIHTRELYQISI